MRPLSVSELIMGVPGIAVARGQSEIVITSTPAGVGMMNQDGRQCQLQVFLDNTPIVLARLAMRMGVFVLNPDTAWTMTFALVRRRFANHS